MDWISELEVILLVPASQRQDLVLVPVGTLPGPAGYMPGPRGLMCAIISREVHVRRCLDQTVTDPLFNQFSFILTLCE